MSARLICGLQGDEAAGAMQVALGVPQLPQAVLG